MDHQQDICLPFRLIRSNARGRLVRLNKCITEIINRHQYPFVVNSYLSELSVLAIALIDGLKIEGTLTLQVTSKGPITLMVVHVNHLGEFRATARYDKTQEQFLNQSRPPFSVQSFFHEGFMVLTLEQKNQKDLFQSMVELMGKTFSECLQHLFRQSDQIETGFMATSSYSTTDLPQKYETASCLMVQKMPDQNDMVVEMLHDAWIDTLARLGSLKSHEMLDQDLPAEQLIHRLFWDLDYEIYAPHLIQEKCTCSRERIEQMLEQFDPQEIVEISEETKTIEITCEFCNKLYHVNKDSFSEKL